MSKASVSEVAKKARRTEYPHRITVRLTEDEFTQLEVIRQALNRGVRRRVSTSDALRAVIVNEASELASLPEVTTSGKDWAKQRVALDGAMEALESVRTQVRRIGTNVNQLTRLAHSTGAMPVGLSETARALNTLTRRLDAIEDGLVAVSYGLEWDLSDADFEEVA